MRGKGDSRSRYEGSDTDTEALFHVLQRREYPVVYLSLQSCREYTEIISINTNQVKSLRRS